MPDLKMSYRLLGLFNRLALRDLMVGEVVRLQREDQTFENYSPSLEELVRRFGQKDAHVQNFVLAALNHPSAQKNAYESLELIERLSIIVADQLERRKLTGLAIEDVNTLKKFEEALIARWHSLLDQCTVGKPGQKADILRSCVLRPEEISHNLRNSAALKLDVR